MQSDGETAEGRDKIWKQGHGGAQHSTHTSLPLAHTSQEKVRKQRKPPSPPCDSQAGPIDRRAQNHHQSKTCPVQNNRRATKLSGPLTNQRTAFTMRTKRSLCWRPADLKRHSTHENCRSLPASLCTLKIKNWLVCGRGFQSFIIHVVKTVFSESLGPIADGKIEKIWCKHLENGNALNILT